MMTKEIEVWVGGNTINYSDRGPWFTDLRNAEIAYPEEIFHKAKLIIELPEKKVTISESEFDEAWKILTYSELDRDWTARFKLLKKKLFGEGVEG